MDFHQEGQLVFKVIAKTEDAETKLARVKKKNDELAASVKKGNTEQAKAIQEVQAQLKKQSDQMAALAKSTVETNRTVASSFREQVKELGQTREMWSKLGLQVTMFGGVATQVMSAVNAKVQEGYRELGKLLFRLAETGTAMETGGIQKLRAIESSAKERGGGGSSSVLDDTFRFTAGGGWQAAWGGVGGAAGREASSQQRAAKWAQATVAARAAGIYDAGGTKAIFDEIVAQGQRDYAAQQNAQWYQDSSRGIGSAGAGIFWGAADAIRSAGMGRDWSKWKPTQKGGGGGGGGPKDGFGRWLGGYANQGIDMLGDYRAYEEMEARQRLGGAAGAAAWGRRNATEGDFLGEAGSNYMYGDTGPLPSRGRANQERAQDILGSEHFQTISSAMLSAQQAVISGNMSMANASKMAFGQIMSHYSSKLWAISLEQGVLAYTTFGTPAMGKHLLAAGAAATAAMAIGAVASKMGSSPMQGGGGRANYGGFAGGRGSVGSGTGGGSTTIILGDSWESESPRKRASDLLSRMKKAERDKTIGGGRFE